MSNTRARPRRREGEVRRLPRADHRLPRAGRRQLRQHSRASTRWDRRPRRSGCSSTAALDGAASRTPPRSPARSARTCARDWRRSSCRASSPPSTRDLELPLSLDELTPRRAGHRGAARAVHAAGAARAAALSSSGGDAGAAALRPPRRDAPRQRRQRRGARRARRGRRAPLRDHHDVGRTSSAGSARCARADAVRLRHRDHQPRLHAGARSSACPSRRARARPPTCRSRTTMPGAPEQLDRASAVLAALKPLLEDPARGKVGHHLKYDAHVLANHGIAARAACASTPCSSPTCWNSVATRHDMDSDAQRYLGITHHHLRGRRRQGREADLLRPGARSSAPAEYAAEDADVTLRLHQALWPQLRGACRALARLYEEIEQPLVPVLQRMEHRGVLVDRELLRAQSREFARAAAGAAAAGAHAKPGTEFNIESPQAAAADPVREAAAAGDAQDADRPALDRRGRARGARRRATRCRGSMLEYRALAKLQVHLHRQAAGADRTRAPAASTPRYHQAVAATGRLSSADPNLQNIPIRTPGRPAHPPGVHRAARATCCWRPTIRRSSCASWRTCRAMRGCCAAFAEDRDMHQATAAEVFGVAARRGDAPTSAAPPRPSTSA